MIRFGTLGAAAITPRALIAPCVNAVKPMRVVDRCHRSAGLPLRGDPDVDR